MKQRVICCKLGRRDYAAVEALQNELVALRQQERIPDVLLLVEHEPVITLGRRADPAHILASATQLDAQGIAVCRTERGGDVTYHGPGQMVVYPILYLPGYGLGPSDYMHRLEDIAAATAADYGIATLRRPGVIGVWAGNNKLAALGVRIKRGVCYHGVALNVSSDMAHWSLIVPCGITDGGVTSLARELGWAPTLEAVEQRFCAHFESLMDAELDYRGLDALRQFEITPDTTAAITLRSA